METCRVMGGNHSRKTAAFVRVRQWHMVTLPQQEVSAKKNIWCSVSPPSRHVPPTVSSPSRLSAASSAVSVSTCSLVRWRWQTSVSLRVTNSFPFELMELLSAHFRLFSVVFTSQYLFISPHLQRMLSSRRQSVFSRRFPAPSVWRGNFGLRRASCWTSSTTSWRRCWLSR